MKYKEYTKAEVIEFCKGHFIEQEDWLWKFVKGCKANISMKEKEVLTVRIQPSE